MFIAIEGADGVGKTTQAKKLYDYLVGCGNDVVLTKEPGGTKVGSLFRDIALSFGYTIRSNTTRLVLLADHIEHMETVVIPALLDKKIVISDRGINSAIVYQGLMKGEYISTKNLYKDASYKAWKTEPDVVLWIDLEAKDAVARMDAREVAKDRNDSKPLDWHKKIRRTYSFVFEEKMYVGGNYHKIDGSDEENVVHTKIKEALNGPLN